MEVVSLSPLRVGSLLWQPRPNAYRLTVVCKATFEIAQGEARLSEVQEHLNDDDNYWNDDPARSLYSPTDMAPFKMRADVLVVGHAFAARGEPVRSLVARIAVSELDKVLDVVGNRALASDGSRDEPQPFTRMPLRYERAIGGADTVNPVGISLDDPSVATSPNIQLPGAKMLRPSGTVEAAGFGPIAPGWPRRRAQLGRHEATWSTTGWIGAPLPDDIELGYFNAAPRDQQIETIRDNERIVLENLNHEHEKLVTRLPGFHPRAFVERPGRAPEDLPMRGDTLWIDTDRSICTVAFRGQVVLDGPNDAGRVLVALEDARQRVTWADIERLVSLPPQARKRAVPEAPPLREHVEAPVQVPAPPVANASLSEINDRIAAGLSETPGARLPSAGPPPLPVEVKAATGPAARFMANAAPPLAPGGGTLTAAPRAQVPVASPVAAPPRIEVPNAVVFAKGGAPRMVDEPNLPTMEVAMARLPNPVALSHALPFARADVGPSRAAGPPPLPQAIVARPMTDDPMSPTTDEPARVSSGMPAWLSTPSVPPTEPGGTSSAEISTLAEATQAIPLTRVDYNNGENTPRRLDERVREHAIRNDVTEISRADRATSADPIELLYVEPNIAPRLRTVSAWESLLEEKLPPLPLLLVPSRIVARGLEPSDAVREPEARARERQEAYAILSRGEPTGLDESPDTLARSISLDGTFEPPMVLLEGDLEVGLDEIETLRAALIALSPFLPRSERDKGTPSADRPLREAVDVAREWLDARGGEGGASVAEVLLARIRDVWSRGGRPIPQGYLDTHVVRIALEARAFQTRRVFGGSCLRGELRSQGAPALPIYLPLGLSERLPLFRRFRARILAEVHLPQEQHDEKSCALLALGIARRVPGLALEKS